MNKKKVVKVKRTIIPKKIEAYDPITKERDMSRTAINEDVYGHAFLETKLNDRGK